MGEYQGVKKAGFMLVVLLLGTACLRAADPQQDFSRANQAFSENKFSEAAALYDSLIKNRGASTELFYNLGNALARAGDPGRAVLAYERGLLLSPRDAELKINLEKVRQKNNLYEKPPAFWEQPFLLVSQNAWAGFCLVAAWVVALCFLCWVLFGKKVANGPRYALVATGTLFLAFGFLGVAGSLIHGTRADRAVVLTPNLPLLISPFANATVSTALKPGEVVHVGETHGEYVYVKNDEGKSGWVRAHDLEKLQ